MFQRDLLLPLRIGPFLLSQVCRIIRLSLSFTGGPALHLGSCGIPDSQVGLFLGPVPLLVGYRFLLIGDILHLLADTLHDGGILLGGHQPVHLILHGGQLPPGLPETHVIGGDSHTGDDGQCDQRRYDD